MAEWMVDNIMWVGTTMVGVIVGVKIALVRVFNRLASTSSEE